MKYTKKVIVCRGIPGSGKSTWAKKFVSEDSINRIRINKDDIRNMLGTYWVPERENLVEFIYNCILNEALLNEYDYIVIDNMNLNNKTCDNIKDAVKEFGNSNYTIDYKDFFIPLDEAIKRDSLREHPIGADTIKSIYRKYKYIFDAEAKHLSLIDHCN